MQKIYEYEGHELFCEKYRDDLSYDTLYRYEVKKPDGTTHSIDVYPLVQMRDNTFKLFVESGCPNRYNLKSLEAMTASDIEIYHYEKFLSKKERS